MNTNHRHITSSLLPGLLILGLVACGGASAEPTPTPPDGNQPQFNPIVSATGVVVPEEWATLSIGASGEIEELPIEIGDEVPAGDLLVTLDSQPTLRAAVASARMELVNAENALQELEENAAMERANVRQELADAQDELDDAEYLRRVRQKGNRASSSTIEAAEARLLLAEERVDRAKEHYDKLSGRPKDSEARALALLDLENARQSRDSAERTLNWYTGAPTEIEQALLDADVAVAEARVADAERELERLEDGPDARELEAAQARVENARAQLEAAELELEGAELRAPFAGTVGEVHVRNHSWVAAGTAIVTMGNLTSLRIETTDLNEIDAARVRAGDPVTITVDALPEYEGRGTVRRIAPKASAGTGVNYTALIDVEDLPDDVRWGMTAFVDIEVDE